MTTESADTKPMRPPVFNKNIDNTTAAVMITLAQFNVILQ